MAIYTLYIGDQSSSIKTTLHSIDEVIQTIHDRAENDDEVTITVFDSQEHEIGFSENYYDDKFPERLECVDEGGDGRGLSQTINEAMKRLA